MKNSTPQQAEHKVANWLVSRGCQILHRNLRGIGSELDIVAWTGHGIVVVEVKMRTEPLGDYGPLLSHAKKRSLIRGLRRYLAQSSLQVEWMRIDLAVVRRSDLQIIDYLPGAVDLDEYESLSQF